MIDLVRAPFPWFGGKRRCADAVWRALGPECPNYVEPFAGSLAVLLARPGGAGKIETVNDRDRYLCVAPETRVLAGDLTWRAAGDLKIGDELIAFDEENPGAAPKGLRAPSQYRRWRHSQVVAAPRVKLPCYRLTFDDGTTVIASEDHCWLAGSHKTGKGGRGWRWVKTKSLVCNRKTQRSWVLKCAPVVHREETWEAGWIGGLFDGEGSLIIGPGSKLVLAQNAGEVLKQAEEWLHAHGFAFETRPTRDCFAVTILGGLKEILRFLMISRPGRLVRKLRSQLEELSLYGREHSAVGLVAKEYLGEQEVIALATTTRTFVAEGLASHNCNFWRAVSADPEAVARWADWPVNEADLHARHKWLVNQTEFRERMHADPDFFDVKIAGWWVWGLCQWIGGGWCVEPNNHKHPKLDGIGKGVHSEAGHAKRPHLAGVDKGVNRQLPTLAVTAQGAAAGRGIHAAGIGLGQRQHLSSEMGVFSADAYSPGRRPALSTAGSGVHLPSLGNDRGLNGVAMAPCVEWFLALQQRLRRVRVACGDWKRVLGDSVLGKGKNVGCRRPCAVFLDPPYSFELRDPYLYSEDDGAISALVRDWALEHGDDRDLRIALCGYSGEHEMPATWTEYAWKGARGYASEDNQNREKERIWFSPYCLPVTAQQQLFAVSHA